MINGFKGGDYNAMAGVTTVRQKHAHSWVEALVGRTGGRPTIAADLDDPRPHPGRPAQRLGRPGRRDGQQLPPGHRLHPLRLDLLHRRLQLRAAGPLPLRPDPRADRARPSAASRSWASTIRGWLHFPSVESFFSLRGFVVSFAALLLLVGLARLATWAVRRLIRRISGAEGRGRRRAGRRSSSIGGCSSSSAEYGLERPPAETPREFARRAADLPRRPRLGDRGRRRRPARWSSTPSTGSASASTPSARTTSTTSPPGSTPSKPGSTPQKA